MLGAESVLLGIDTDSGMICFASAFTVCCLSCFSIFFATRSAAKASLVLGCMNTASRSMKAIVDTSFSQALSVVSLMSKYFVMCFSAILLVTFPRTRSKRICLTTLKVQNKFRCVLSHTHIAECCPVNQPPAFGFPWLPTAPLWGRRFWNTLVWFRCSSREHSCFVIWLRSSLGFSFAHLRLYPDIFVLANLSVQKLGSCTCIFVIAIYFSLRCTEWCLLHVQNSAHCRFRVVRRGLECWSVDYWTVV